MNQWFKGQSFRYNIVLFGMVIDIEHILALYEKNSYETNEFGPRVNRVFPHANPSNGEAAAKNDVGSSLKGLFLKSGMIFDCHSVVTSNPQNWGHWEQSKKRRK